MLVSMGLSWDDVGNFGKNVATTVGKIAVAPIVVPLQISAEAAKYGLQKAQELRNTLKPPQQAAAPAPDYMSLFGLGGAGTGGLAATGGGNVSTLPLILGGVAAAGLLVFALVSRRGGK